MRALVHVIAMFVTVIATSPRVLLSADDGETPQDVKGLLERLEKVEAELTRLDSNRKNGPRRSGDERFLTLLETPHYGSTSYYQNGKWYFASKLVFINLGKQDVTVARKDIVLDVEGDSKALGEIPETLVNYSFRVGSKSFQIRDLKTPETIKVPSGGSASSWVFFGEMPSGPSIPKMTLSWKVGGKPHSLNVNEFCLGLLGLNVERIGPYGSLAVVTINGAFDMVNIDGFVAALDDLAAKKVVRVVIRWGKEAVAPESELRSWLQQRAQMAGTTVVNNSSRRQFPTVPATLRELHLVDPPGSSTRSASSGPIRLHKTEDDAITTALSSVYAVLPRDELLKEIQQGDVLTRAAALAAGGGRLDAERLPLILKLTNDGEPRIQNAALTALRHFGERRAVEQLVHYARTNKEPLVSTAIRSLAGSRYASAHRALLKLLEGQAPAGRVRIVKILAQYPRPLWSQALYDFSRDADAKVRLEAIRALVRVGHPEILTVLDTALNSGDAGLRTEAFNTLVARTDAKSEELALEFTLKALKTSPPDSPMTNLLTRTKDPRAVPLLLKHFSKNSGSRSTLINLLQQIGDESVAEVFIKEYPKLSEYEKASVLKGLFQLQSPAFKKLAGEALLSKNSSMVSAAAQGLQEDGGPEATALLVAALEKTTHSSTWSYTCNALGSIGSVEARRALVKARSSTDTNKQNYAKNALRSMAQRSPGYQYIYQARNYVQQKNWKMAVTQYTQAVTADDSLAEAFAGRANANHRLDKIDDARKDYEKACELDPYNALAITGKALIKVHDGEVLEGVKFVEANAKKFPNDWTFAYNSGCVYARSLENLNKNDKAENRDARRKTYQARAMEELQKATEYGFRDWSLMRTDPDLNSLRALPQFKKLLPQPTKPGKATTEKKAGGDFPKP